MKTIFTQPGALLIADNMQAFAEADEEAGVVIAEITGGVFTVAEDLTPEMVAALLKRISEYLSGTDTDPLLVADFLANYQP